MTLTFFYRKPACIRIAMGLTILIVIFPVSVTDALECYLCKMKKKSVWKTLSSWSLTWCVHCSPHMALVFRVHLWVDGAVPGLSELWRVGEGAHDPYVVGGVLSVQSPLHRLQRPVLTPDLPHLHLSVLKVLPLSSHTRLGVCRCRPYMQKKNSFSPGGLWPSHLRWLLCLSECIEIFLDLYLT